jgi:hypothetical protein
VRLIDADALRDSFDECPNLVGPYAVDILNAAPTVSCEECRHGEWVNTYAEDVVCSDCYGAQRFERRTP